MARIALFSALAPILVASGCKSDPAPQPMEGLSPSPACDRYLECASAVTPAGLGPLLEGYGWGGTCWGSTQDVSDQCEEACVTGLAMLQQAAPDEPDCTEPVAGSSSGSGSGSGSDPGTDTSSDSGGVAIERAVDLIFVVDNSFDMGAHQGRLATSMDALVETFAAADPPVDLRVAVTTTDNGNPWCGTTGPEAGNFESRSCRDRIGGFFGYRGVEVDARDIACLDVCSLESLDLPDPWIDVGALAAADAAAQLRCLVPEGIDGCQFESPLESLRKAIVRGEENGFRRSDARLAVIILTNSVDCSYNPDHERIFLPEYERTFWSDPTDASPTPAVCFNAGSICTGSPAALDCMLADLTPFGGPAADPVDDASLHPVSIYVEQLQANDAIVMAIDGVTPEGSMRYAATDPDSVHDYGLDPGCESSGGLAIPPARVHEVIEAVSGPGHESSVCATNYDPAITGFAERIIESLPSQ